MVINVAIWVHFSGLTILIRSCITYAMTFELLLVYTIYWKTG